MLVRAFEIEIRRPVRISAAFDRKGMRAPRIEPDIEDVGDLLVIVGIMAVAEEIGVRTREPGVSATFGDQVGDALVDGFVLQRHTRGLVDKHRQRRAPVALPRNEPVRTRLDHAADAIAAGFGEELRRVDGHRRLVPQRVIAVHADEPLWCIAEDDRGLGAPRMRIGVLDAAASQKVAGLDQLRHDGAVGLAELAGLLALGFQHLQAGKQRHGRIIGAVGIDSIGDSIEAAAGFQPHQIVVGAMTGGRVYKTGTGVVGDVVAGQHGHVEAVTGIKRSQRMAERQTAQNVGRHVDDLLPRRRIGSTEHAFGQFFGQDQLVADGGPRCKTEIGLGLHAGDFIDRIGDLGVEADGAVGRDGPRRGRPDDDAGTIELRELGTLRAAGPLARIHRELDPDGG